MKKIIFTLLFFGFFTFTGFSQDKQFTFGIEGGANFQNYSKNNNDVIKSVMAAGWLAGIKARTSGTTWYGQFETYYQQWTTILTSQAHAVPPNGVVTGGFSFQNIQLAATIGAFLTEGSHVLRAFGGFDVAFLTSVNTPNNFNMVNQNVKDANWGARFGVGMDFWDRFALDVIYNIGFTSAFTHADGGFRALSIILGMNIN